MSNRAVVITISDRCSSGAAEDRSGPALIELLPLVDGQLVHREIVPDDAARIAGLVRTWVGRCELILTTGGTGVAKRDVTPEALTPLIERALPGFGELMRIKGYDATPLSIVSRSGAGLIGNTLVVWLPGSTQAVRECLRLLAPGLRHVCEFARGDHPH